MMKKNIFEFLADFFRQTKIQFLLIGGFAVNAYGFSRQTADVDCLIAEENKVKALQRFQASGFKIQAQGPIFARLTHTEYSMDLDLLFVESRTLQNMIKEAKSVKITGQCLPIPSLNHLIALKLHAVKNDPQREWSDLPDILNLVRINRLNVKDYSFQQLCSQFGPPLIYEKILKGSVSG